MLSIWGIININEDSFYSGSRFSFKEALDKICSNVDNLFVNDRFDIGGESSRPGSKPIDATTEWTRIGPLLKELRKRLGEDFLRNHISVDTWKGEIASRAIDLGVGMINDIRAGKDLTLLKAVASSSEKVELVLMHAQGSTETMQKSPQYQSVVDEVIDFLKERTSLAINSGVLPEKIIWDPGIGFGKTLSHNLKLLQNLTLFKQEGYRVLLGVSRKSMFNDLLGITRPEDRRLSSLAAHAILTAQGVDILRVHDFDDTLMMRTIWNNIV